MLRALRRAEGFGWAKRARIFAPRSVGRQNGRPPARARAAAMPSRVSRWGTGVLFWWGVDRLCEAGRRGCRHFAGSLKPRCRLTRCRDSRGCTSSAAARAALRGLPHPFPAPLSPTPFDRHLPDVAPSFSQLMLSAEGALPCLDGTLLCTARDLELNLVFSIANVALLISSLPIGLLLARFGPRAVSVASNCCIAAGAFIIAAAFDGSDHPKSGETSSSGIVLAIGITIMSAFGPGIQLSSVGSAELFPSRKATVVGLLSGMMGGSALILPLYGAVHSAGAGAVTLKGIFWWHGGMVLTLAVATALLLPSGTFEEARDALHLADKAAPSETAGQGKPTKAAAEAASAASAPTTHDDAAPPAVAPVDAKDLAVTCQSPELPSTGEGEESPGITAGSSGHPLPATSIADKTCEPAAAAGGEQALQSRAAHATTHAAAVAPTGAAAAAVAEAASDGPPVEPAGTPATMLGALFQPWFLALLVWFSAQYLRLVLYLGSADLQLREMADATGESPSDAETWLLVLGWVAPFGAVAAPLVGLLQDWAGFAVAMMVVQLVGIGHAAMSLVPALEAQPLTFALYTSQQEALFGVVLAALLSGLGSARFGVGTGVVFICGAICSAIITPITEAIVESGTFFVANIVLLAIAGVTTALPLAQLLGVGPLLPPGEKPEDRAADAAARAH